MTTYSHKEKIRRRYYPFPRIRNLTLCTLLFACTAVHAYDGYLKIDAITVDAKDDDYATWVKSLSFNYSLQRPFDGGRTTTVSLAPLTIVKDVNATSARLLEKTLSGEIDEGKVTIDFVQGTDRFYRLLLHKYQVVSYSVDGSGEMPTESVSFYYSNIEWTYTDILSGAGTKTHYDLQLKKAGIEDIPPPNEAPSISFISNQSTSANTPIDIGFEISDKETPTNSLILTKASSNLSLLPLENITFTGTGSARTVTLEPVFGKEGTTNITISVSDGDKTSERQFQLTVTANSNITSANESFYTGTSSPLTLDGFRLANFNPSSGIVRLTIATTNAKITLATNIPGALIPNEIENNGSSEVIITSTLAKINALLSSPRGLTYQGNDIFVGVGEITFTLDDEDPQGGLNPVQKSIIVNVFSTQNEAWLNKHFPESLGNPDISGDLADPDGDGQNNLAEYALGSNPNKNNDKPENIEIGFDNLEGIVFLEFNFMRRRADNDLSLFLTLEFSNDFKTWKSEPDFTVTEYTAPVNAEFEHAFYQIDSETLDEQPVFARLRIERFDIR